MDGTTPDKGPLDILRWQITDRLAGKRTRPGAPFVTPRRPNDGVPIRALPSSLTWVGHATFLLRLGGKLVTTDPVLSERIQGVVKRLAPVGVRLEDAPPIEVVTVSHSHFDHMDLPSLQRIGPSALYVVPRDNGELLVKAGLPRVVELDWWESTSVGDLRITLVPAQHWSMRAPWDRNTRLWGGFIYEGPEGKAYHAGDTAFSEQVFTEIGARHPGIDWAMLPIGAYDPPWFMGPQHMGPEEAIEAHRLLGARNLVAMHWGTFKLTDEPTGEPPERARARWKDLGLPEERLWVVDLGETRAL